MINNELSQNNTNDTSSQMFNSSQIQCNQNNSSNDDDDSDECDVDLYQNDDCEPGNYVRFKRRTDQQWIYGRIIIIQEEKEYCMEVYDSGSDSIVKMDVLKKKIAVIQLLTEDQQYQYLQMIKKQDAQSGNNRNHNNYNITDENATDLDMEPHYEGLDFPEPSTINHHKNEEEVPAEIIISSQSQENEEKKNVESMLIEYLLPVSFITKYKSGDK